MQFSTKVNSVIAAGILGLLALIGRTVHNTNPQNYILDPESPDLGNLTSSNMFNANEQVPWKDLPQGFSVDTHWTKELLTEVLGRNKPVAKFEKENLYIYRIPDVHYNNDKIFALVIKDNHAGGISFYIDKDASLEEVMAAIKEAVTKIKLSVGNKEVGPGL